MRRFETGIGRLAARQSRRNAIEDKWGFHPAQCSISYGYFLRGLFSRYSLPKIKTSCNLRQSSNIQKMSNLLVPSLYIFLSRALLIQADNVNLCYFGPGEENRAFSDLVPCSGSGTSACCLLGSVCLTGNACWDPTTGDTYQYGCTDITYTDQSCPSKCGFNTSKLLSIIHTSIDQLTIVQHVQIGSLWSTAATSHQIHGHATLPKAVVNTALSVNLGIQIYKFLLRTLVAI